MAPITQQQESRARTVCLLVLTVLAIGAALYVLRPVLVPFVLALFLTTGVGPVLNAIETRFKAPRIVAVGVTFVLGMVLLALFSSLIWLSASSLLDDADMYRQRLKDLADRAESLVPRNLLPGQGDSPSESEQGNGSDDDSTPPSGENGGGASNSGDDASAPSADNGGASNAADAKNDKPDEPNALAQFVSRNTGAWVSQLSGALMELLSSAVIVLIFMFFLILGDATTASLENGVWKEIESSIRNYIVTKGLISIVTGVAFGFTLWIFGVPLALVFGLLAVMLNFIPNIGPIIASLLPLPLILLDPSMSLVSMILVIVITSTIQIVSGNVIEPKIMGDSFELHPVAVLLSLMLWGMMWGIVGMFLAVPITAAIKILLERFDQTRPIAELLAGKMEALQHLGEQVDVGGESSSG